MNRQELTEVLSPVFISNMSKMKGRKKWTFKIMGGKGGRCSNAQAALLLNRQAVDTFLFCSSYKMIEHSPKY